MSALACVQRHRSNVSLRKNLYFCIVLFWRIGCKYTLFFRKSPLLGLFFVIYLPELRKSSTFAPHNQHSNSIQMIGTIVNTCTIIVGSLIGTLLHRGVKDAYKEVLYTGLGLASLAIGLNATISHLGESEYPVLFIVALAVGGVTGTALDIDGHFKRLVDRLKKGDGSARSGNRLADGLATAILLYCIGPLSMLGPVISALKGDHTFLFTNATLDFVSSMVFASTYGIGMVLAAPVLFCWQGLFYLVANVSSTAISDGLMAELLIVGGLMIMGSGLGLLNLKDCKTLNLLPALLVPVIWYLIVSIL